MASTIYHLLNQHWRGPGGGVATGVPRFSMHFKQAFGHVVNITPADLPVVRFRDGDAVVTDNHLSLMVPDRIRTIVVHHGCAETHYERDPKWRSAANQAMCRQQRDMFKKPNRIFVAPSRWVAEQFMRWKPLDCAYGLAQIIPHWVPILDRYGEPKDAGQGGPGGPWGQVWLVIGDWRNDNKGSFAVERIRSRAGVGIRFEQLCFSPGDIQAKSAAYFSGDVYLNLSASEGFGYSMADAEARAMPIVSTDTGAAREFGITEFADRENPDQVLDLIRRAQRRRPSFFASWTLQRWREAYAALMYGGV